MHVLPLEYYPPAINLLELMAKRPRWEVRAWTSANRRRMPKWTNSRVVVSRLAHPAANIPVGLRMPGYLAWHLRSAAAIARWNPRAVIAVEPHSALAAWIYFTVFRGSAALFIHHHEYYSREDLAAGGMRFLRATVALERRDLFPRATWVSQTNEDRLHLLQAWNDGISDGAAKVFPNFPPAKWVRRVSALASPRPSATFRLVYVGSASFQDTFVREICIWARDRQSTVSLHICGNNVEESVWSWVQALGALNITCDRSGVAYDALPDLLRQFDAGLVLYKGNTVNFVHNVPNKAIEYLACGLEVWYPPQMKSMKSFHQRFPEYRFREIDFENLPPAVHVSKGTDVKADFPFTLEAASAPLIAALENLRPDGDP